MTAPAPTAALASTLARDWVLEVETATGTWTKVRGLNSVSPIFEGAEQDDSDIDSEGYASSIVTGLAFRIEGSGKRKGEQTTGFVDDPGQSFLRQRAARPAPTTSSRHASTGATTCRTPTRRRRPSSGPTRRPVTRTRCRSSRSRCPVAASLRTSPSRRPRKPLRAPGS